jgi:hypothetical protein
MLIILHTIIGLQLLYDKRQNKLNILILSTINTNYILTFYRACASLIASKSKTKMYESSMAQRKRFSRELTYKNERQKQMAL